MFDKFTDRARKVMSLAQDEARGLDLDRYVPKRLNPQSQETGTRKSAGTGFNCCDYRVNTKDFKTGVSQTFKSHCGMSRALNPQCAQALSASRA